MRLEPLLGAAGLASAWMLWWGLAAAIPVLLHYLYRRRQTIIPWAAMQLLHQVVQREARRVRLEQWLLLCLRTLILLTLAVALARPFWNTAASGSNLTSAPATNWIIAIDVSYSMGYRVDNETRLQAAQRRATELIDTARQGDAFAVIALGQPPRGVVASPSFDRAAVQTELGRMRINDAGCDLKAGLQLMQDIAQRAVADPTLPGQVRLLIISDLGREHWQSAIDGVDAKLLKQLGQQFPLEIESLGDEAVANLAVTDVRTDAVRGVVGQPVTLDVTLSNFGNEVAEQVPVQLVVDGNTVSSQRVTIAPHDAQSTRFLYVPSSLGLQVLSVTLPADRLPVDDTHRQVIDVVQESEVLIIEEQPGAARVVKLSLDPQQPSTIGQPRTSVSPFELSTVELAKWPVIVLYDLSTLDAAQAQRVENYVRQGGGLICMLGAQTQAAAWNNRDLARTLLGFELLEPSAEQLWNIDPLEYRSSIVAPFAGFPDAGLLTTPIFRYWKIRLPEPRPTGWEVDLATDQGEPLIARHRLGSGVVISLLSAPESGANPAGSWNALATWPSFVPLMQRLVQSASDVATSQHTTWAGQPLIGKLDNREQRGAAQAATLTIVRPDGTESQLNLDDRQADGSFRWTYVQTQQSGVYVVRNSDASELQPFAVNVDGSESRLQSVRPEQLPKFNAPAPVAVAQADSLSPGVEASPWLARSLLLALGCLLITESWLAWWLGRRWG